MKVVPMHVAVFAFPFGTHAAPLLNLVHGIAAEAPQIKFSFFNTKKSNACLFTGENEHGFRNIKPYNVYDGWPEDHVPSGNPVEPILLFIKVMPHNYRIAMEAAVAETGNKFTCLLTDAFLSFSAQMAEEMHVKWVALWTAGPNSILTHVFTDFIRERVASCAGDDDQKMDFLPGFSSVNASDLPDGVIADTENPFSIMLHKMGLMLPRATAVTINSFLGLQPLIVNELESKIQMLLNIGPFNLTMPQPRVADEEGCLEWLENHRNGSVVYISFGSVISPPPHELAAVAEALEECGYPFIWAFKGNPEKQLPSGFLERTRAKGKIVALAPQIEILKHDAVGVCITHCGWNTILECIVGGVPMICRPFFGDQKLNTSMLESVWGVGERVENGVFTKEATVRALKSAMSSEKGKIAKQRIQELKESAMEAVEPNGSFRKNFRSLIEIVTS